MLSKFVVIFLLILFPFSSIAQTKTSTTGQFSILKKGDPAKFDGVLFDPTATATILTESEFKEREFKLKLKHELEKQQNNRLD